MSTPYWRLPAVRLELCHCYRARRRLWLLLQSAVLPLLVLGGFPPWLIGAGICLPAADLLRCRLRLPMADVRFDGRHWWLVAAGQGESRLRLDAVGYCSPALLAASLSGGGQSHALLLWRAQVGTETWRRLCLALRYGVSTVSTASGARSG